MDEWKPLLNGKRVVESSHLAGGGVLIARGFHSWLPLVHFSAHPEPFLSL